MLPIYKEHNLSSIHNVEESVRLSDELLPIYKEHNLSSIHNKKECSIWLWEVVTNIQRTQFKFNSQHRRNVGNYTQCCYQYTKNTI